MATAYAMISKDGDRLYNEDSIRAEVSGNCACFVLADGLGGHGGGADASKLVADSVLEQFRKNGLSENFLPECFENSQQLLLDYQRGMGRENEMKTTMVVLIRTGNTVQWGHIGDSRLYCFRNGTYESRTFDHSVPQMLVAAGQIKEKEIRGHADRNRLLRVMGTEWDKPEYEIADPIDVDSDLSFLLCSDGFWELILEKDMEKQLRKSGNPEKWIEQMENIVLRNGRKKNKDNYSAIAVSMGPER